MSIGNRHTQLSNALRITNVNDFLAPTNSCVLPLDGGAFPSPAPQSYPAGSVLAPIIPTATTPSETTSTSATPTPSSSVAKVTVSDCLACSGCVTSAETVLLSNASIESLLSFSKSLINDELTTKPRKRAICLLSQQSAASLAARYNITLATAARKVATFFTKCLNFDAVVNGAFATHVSVMETTEEFLKRLGHKNNHNQNKKNLPLLTSSCPGWLTYAEKTHAKILPCLSTIPSSQATFAKLFPRLDKDGHTNDSDDDNSWIVTVAPCHDRKLEAVRPEFSGLPNCVITTSELDMLMHDEQYGLNFNFSTAEETEVMFTTQHDQFGARVDSTSDGYAAHAARITARDLCGYSTDELKDIRFEKVSKSGDVTVAIVTDKHEYENGNENLKTYRFATAYGFRSMQSILRKIKQGNCAYDFIEIMACPGGCTNGGGQLSSGSSTDRNEAKKILNDVNERFFEHQHNDIQKCNDDSKYPSSALVSRVYHDVIDGVVGSANATSLLHINVTARDVNSQVTTPASLDW